MIAAESRPLAEALVDEIIARHPDPTGDVLAILEEIQQKHPLKYLPPETHELVALPLRYDFFEKKPGQK